MAKSSFFSGTGTTSNDVDSITSSKAAAEAAATNAATSETNAASSASSASTSASNASTSASNASNSATAAATSETNAASSATAASASQTSATNSASAAATSATNAATSEANAATSETNAASSATAAATSATNAATSLSNIGAAETNAANSATAAATSATNASTSATNAATSETNAATSASTASTAATNAATSETNAATSETNAATSATNAATSETNAATSATSASTSASAASTSATAAAASQSAAAASAASAASAYDTFDDRYLGSKTADPTVDNDGNALVSGALYFNSTANEMRVYDGANWIAATSAGNVSLLEYKYTATSGQTTFSGADDSSNTLSYTQDNLIVTLNGVMLENGTDYTATTGTSVVLASGAATSDELNVIAFKSFTTADMVSSANGGTFYNNIDVQGTVTADGLTVDGNVTVQKNNPVVTIADTGTSNQQSFIRQLSGTLYFDGQSGATADGSFLFRGYDGSTNKMLISYNGDISFYEDTGTTAKFFWDASAELLKIGGIETIGTFPLMVKSNASHHGIHIEEASGNEGYTLGVDADGDLGFYNSGSTTASVTFDDSGNVGIGTTSPLAGLYSTVGHISGTSGGLILSSSTSTFGIGSVAGVLQIYDSTNAAERMRIDSSGNLLVGTTETYPGAGTAENRIGISIENTYGIHASTNGQRSLLLNRMTSDGDILQLRKDGTTVGSIASRSGLVSTFILDPRSTSNGGVGITATGSTSQPALLPTDEAGSLTNGAINLGASGERWQDLYLSGGVYLGGTGAANKLDDYEEGTWTPEYVFYDISDAAYKNFAGITYDIQEGTYVKVGRLVTLFFSLRTDSLDKTGTASSDLVSIDNLPFNVVEGGTGTIGAAVNWASAAPTQSFASAGETIALRTTLSGASGYNAIDVGDMATGANSNRILDCVIQYQTNA